jgi:hypothetical protein
MLVNNMRADLLISRVLSEGKVYRMDGPDVDINSKHLNSYAMGKGVSGKLEPGEKAPKGTMFATGLFAGDRKHVAPYAVPRDARRVSQGRTVWFDSRDRNRINSFRPVEREYDDASFRHIKSTGERMSRNPGEPTRKTVISDPVGHMRSQGWDVRFHRDLDSLVSGMRKRGINVDTEGEFK